MIKRHLTTIICLALLALVNLYSLFEVITAPHIHTGDHFYHQSVNGFLTVVFLMVYFRRQLFLHAGKFSGYKVLAVVLLLVFTFIHLAPAKTSFAYHHQSQSQDGSEHPCCMPQLTVLSPSLEMSVASIEFIFFNDFSQKEVFSLIKNINNKSPPLS